MEKQEQERNQAQSQSQARDWEREERLATQRRAREEIGQFAALFPGVGPRQVPEEVWQEVHRGENLALAYALWRIKTLEAALRQRENNARLSAGSVSSAGSTTPGGTVAAFWDAYEM